MAAIEKIDEMTGEYPGWKMYDYKRNHIQVCPWNRKAFKGAKHVLVITKSERQIMWKGGGTSTLDNSNWMMDVEYCHDRSKVSLNLWRGPGYYLWSGQQYSPDQYLKKIRVTQEYWYDLYCPELPGEVQGHYTNYSTDLSSVKRRLKRMIGSDLNIVYADVSRRDLTKYAEELYNELKD